MDLSKIPLLSDIEFSCFSTLNNLTISLLFKDVQKWKENWLIPCYYWDTSTPVTIPLFPESNMILQGSGSFRK